MVVYVKMENSQKETSNARFNNMTSNQTQGANCDFDFKETCFNNSKPSNSPPQKSNVKQLHTKIQLITGSTQPQNIGLHVKTNLCVKSKNRLGRNVVKFVLYCLLLGHLIWTTHELQGLRRELDMTKMQLDFLTDSLDFLSGSFYQKEQKNAKLDKLIKDKAMPEGRHLLDKRAAELPIAYSDCTNCTRQARSISRGKHCHSKNRNCCRRRCYRTSGPFAIHLKGALPEITVRDGGIIAPWYIDKPSSGVFLLEDGIIGEGRGIVEIIEEGLYFIYAQMYYLTSDTLNSYAINLHLAEDEGRGVKRDQVIAVCSAEAASHKWSELSCYTAVVRYLQRGDRIYLTQRERNRKIIFRDNRSFFGLTLLNSSHGFPQLS